MNIIQAVNEVLKGKQIRHKKWTKNCYIRLIDNQIKFGNGTDVTMLDEQFLSNDFEVAILTFDDLNLGDKFRWEPHGCVCVKTYIPFKNAYAYFVINSSYTHWVEETYKCKNVLLLQE